MIEILSAQFLSTKDLDAIDQPIFDWTIVDFVF